MIRTALLLVRDLLRFVALTCTSHASLAAENLFLRRQLAFYLEGDLVFQKGLRKQLLHTGVFGLELLQSLRVGDAHPENLLRHKQWLASEKLWRRLRSLRADQHRPPGESPRSALQ